jgi:putative acetyltransferase
MTRLYPPESNHMLEVSELEQPEVSFYLARIDGAALGCGAWVRIGPKEAELKRMFVSPEARGQKIGRQLLEYIEMEAIAAGIHVMRLETGIRQPEAIALYHASGYVERGPFGGYCADPLSTFMEKQLAVP